MDRINRDTSALLESPHVQEYSKKEQFLVLVSKISVPADQNSKGKEKMTQADKEFPSEVNSDCMEMQGLPSHLPTWADIVAKCNSGQPQGRNHDFVEGEGQLTSPPDPTQAENVQVAEEDLGLVGGVDQVSRSSPPNPTQERNVVVEVLGPAGGVGLDSTPDDTELVLGCRSDDRNWVDSIDEENNILIPLAE
ncbi:hypothetical protein V6N13_092314 [Hibiscus sabdariffa]